MAKNITTNNAVIAVNRFGLGARGNELEQAKKDPKAWLKQTLTSIEYKHFTMSSGEVIERMIAYREEKKQLKKKAATGQAKNNSLKASKENSPSQLLKLFVLDSAKSAIQSNNSISWRLLDFFSNHFSVTAGSNKMRGLAPTLEREAIAPNLLGKFENMLLEVIKHPAMLVYLNNEKSFGPNTRLGKRGKGLNENLAREILELHTLGVNGGYQQVDVIELAKGITGWSVDISRKAKSKGFIFRKQGHEPGVRYLLGRSYQQQGVKQGEAMLLTLARHENTARYICQKLVKHFISDQPNEVLVQKLVSRWQTSQGNIKQVMHELIDAPEAWQMKQDKYKTPREFVISTYRALNLNFKRKQEKHLTYSLQMLGQRPFSAGSPAGFSDDKKDWNGSSALMSRIDWSSRVAAMAGRINADDVLTRVFGGSLTKHTYQRVIRAESRKHALTLLLMSPEFQRR